MKRSNRKKSGPGSKRSAPICGRPNLKLLPSNRYRKGDLSTATAMATDRSVPATPLEANLSIGDFSR
jgi:hypothetical protein